MDNSRVLCYVGAKVVGPRILKERINAHIDLGAYTNSYRQPISTLTLVPPFYTTSSAALSLNVGCSVATMLKGHFLQSVPFRLEKMAVWPSTERAYLYFKVSIGRGKESGALYTQRLQEYIGILLKKVEEVQGFSWRDKAPPELNPYVTIMTIKNDSGGGIPDLREKLETMGVYSFIGYHNSNEIKRVAFRVITPTLYIKSGGIWKPIE